MPGDSHGPFRKRSSIAPRKGRKHFLFLTFFFQGNYTLEMKTNHLHCNFNSFYLQLTENLWVFGVFSDFN